MSKSLRDVPWSKINQQAPQSSAKILSKICPAKVSIWVRQRRLMWKRDALLDCRWGKDSLLQGLRKFNPVRNEMLAEAYIQEED